MTQLAHERPIEGFRADSKCGSLAAFGGIAATGAAFVSEAGTRIHLSPEGAAQNDPAFFALLGRIGQYVDAHDGYKDPAAVAREEALHVLQVSGNKDRATHRIANTSVYLPLEAPGTIIKAYDNIGTRQAHSAYRRNAKLHRQLAAHEVALDAVAQYALVRSPSGRHNTVVMQRADGDSVEKNVAQYNGGRLPDIDYAVRTEIVDRLWNSIGSVQTMFGRFDISDTNVFAPSGVPLTPETIPNTHFTMIDAVQADMVNSVRMRFNSSL